MSSLVVMGDSAATGIGDPVGEGIYKGWGHYLFKALPKVKEYHNLSRPGARVNEMVTVQLEIALEIRPKIVIFIIGGNDVLRNNFDPTSMYRELAESIERLRKVGADVYAMNLHDPTRVIPLPRVLKKVLTRRVEAVNKIYEALSLNYELKLLNITQVEEVYDKSLWHIDRMHPNKIGHQKLATLFAELLRRNGHKSLPIYAEPAEVISRIDGLKWLLRNATPWFAKRSVDLLPVIVLLTICELFGITDRIAPKFEIPRQTHDSPQLIA